MQNQDDAKENNETPQTTSDPLIRNSKNTDGFAVKAFRNLSASAIKSDREGVREYYAKRSTNDVNSDVKKSTSPSSPLSSSDISKAGNVAASVTKATVSEGAGASVQAATQVASALQEGGVSGALEAGVGAAKTAGGAWLVDFLWYSVLEIFPGGLYGLPALTLYMFIGIFVQSPEWHQLSKWKMAVIIGLDILVIFLLVLLVVIIMYTYCTGITGALVKGAAAVGVAPDFCAAFKS